MKSDRAETVLSEEAVFLCAAKAGLEPVYPAEMETLVSFLVNALYLFGGQSLAVPGGAPEGVTAELTRLGHRVRTGLPLGSGRQGRSGAEGARRAGQGSNGNASGNTGGQAQADRIFVPHALGQGSDAEILASLRGLRGSLRPGGLVCFHVFDRDRAWERAGSRNARVDGIEARLRVEFDPASGRLSARATPAGEARAVFRNPALALASTSVKTWNLGELAGLLRSAGLVLERAYGDWEGGSPGHTASGRLIVVAARPRKRGNPRQSAQEARPQRA